MSNLNQTTLSDAVKTQYERRLLIRAFPRLLHSRWARKATINKFGSYELRRYEGLSAVTTALDESNTPAEESAPTVTVITLTPAWYGAWIGYGDEIEMTIFDPLVSEITEVLGEQAGLSADTIVRNTITAGASKDYSGGQVSRGALDYPAHEISYDDIVNTLASLMAGNALPVMGQYYAVIIHPHTFASLMKNPTFVNTFQAEAGALGKANDMRSGYIGMFLMCEFYISSNVREYVDGGAGTDDVYSMLFIGKESYGIVGIGNLLPKEVDMGGADAQPLTGQRVKPVEVIAKQLGSAGADDPLNQRATLGWKLTLDQTVLNTAFIRDLEHVNDFSAS